MKWKKVGNSSGRPDSAGKGVVGAGVSEWRDTQICGWPMAILVRLKRYCEIKFYVILVLYIPNPANTFFQSHFSNRILSVFLKVDKTKISLFDRYSPDEIKLNPNFLNGMPINGEN
jgi:hypothetical protein